VLLKNNKFICIQVIILAVMLSVIGKTQDVYGLAREEILVVANTRMAESVEIARYYMDKREIPPSHLVLVGLTLNETMSRDEYDKTLKEAILKALKRVSSERIAVIVLIYGIPLKVDPPELSWEDNEQLRQYKGRHNNMTHLSVEKDGGIDGQKDDLLQNINSLLKTDQRAAVDSELALIKKGEYNLQGWIKNPYFIGFQGMPSEILKDQVLLVSRLDGPDAATVYRIINDTLQAEKEGLQGKAYFDARWPRPPAEVNTLGGYQRYDLSLHRAADAAATKMETVIDQREELFTEKCCPAAALYCGWYSLGHYIDSFDWQRGAIGYHIASAECTTLRDKNSSVWCVKMLEKGVAATIGPVFEPYVQGFPLPDLFFSQLIERDMSLGEAYLTSLPYLSWQMVLVGDPLYQPFLQKK
jgi:uncharacterized protein (TIGR03790 family)